ncbi:MAG: biotin/lipoyl-containing protein [Sandaracinaceae bacterium]
MNYRVMIDGVEREVDVILAPGGGASITLDGTPVDADVERVPGGVRLKLGNAIFDVAVGGTAERLDLAAGVARARAMVESPRARAKKKKSGGLSGGGDEIRSPMPGRIVSVPVEVGQAVEQGDPCIVIEAMKMENELRAPKSGKVKAIHAAQGADVEAGALLVSFES